MTYVQHGTYTAYTTHKCRCDDCKQAQRDYRTSVRERGLPDPTDSRHGTRNGYYNYGCRCDPCKAVAKTYSKARLDSGAVRNAYLNRTYGLTSEQWEVLFASQGGACASCGDVPAKDAKVRFHVDHDHSTGAVRGILCHSCNVALGHLKEDQERIAKLGVYLAQWKPF